MQWATRVFFVSLLIPVFLFAKVEIVNVEVEGIGSSKKAAIDSALVEAVSQVNGAEIASKTKRQLIEVVNDKKQSISIIQMQIDLNAFFKNSRFCVSLFVLRKKGTLFFKKTGKSCCTLVKRQTTK